MPSSIFLSSTRKVEVFKYVVSPDTSKFPPTVTFPENFPAPVTSNSTVGVSVNIPTRLFVALTSIPEM
jgi:hypothetical protein